MPPVQKAATCNWLIFAPLQCYLKAYQIGYRHTLNNIRVNKYTKWKFLKSRIIKKYTHLFFFEHLFYVFTSNVRKLLMLQQSIEWYLPVKYDKFRISNFTCNTSATPPNTYHYKGEEYLFKAWWHYCCFSQFKYNHNLLLLFFNKTIHVLTFYWNKGQTSFTPPQFT